MFLRLDNSFREDILVSLLNALAVLINNLASKIYRFWCLKILSFAPELHHSVPSENISYKEKEKFPVLYLWHIFCCIRENSAHTLVLCLNGVIFFNNTEFVQLLHTDRQFQMKVGGITASVFAGALLAGRGRKYSEFFCNLPLTSQDFLSESRPDAIHYVHK